MPDTYIDMVAVCSECGTSRRFGYWWSKGLNGALKALTNLHWLGSGCIGVMTVGEDDERD